VEQEIQRIRMEGGVRAEETGFVIESHWREPDGRGPPLSFPRMTGEQFQTLRESGADEARRIAD